MTEQPDHFNGYTQETYTNMAVTDYQGSGGEGVSENLDRINLGGESTDYNLNGNNTLNAIGAWDSDKVILERKSPIPPGAHEEHRASSLTKDQVRYFFSRYWCHTTQGFKDIDESFIQNFRD